MSAASFQAQHPGLVWSNSQASEEALICAALLHPRFHVILDTCLEFGLDKVLAQWNHLQREATSETQLVTAEVNRILNHIEEGFADAQAGH